MISLTPLSKQVLHSEDLIARDALVMSGCSTPYAGAEELEPTAGTGGFDGRRLEFRGFAELFGDHGGEGVNRGRPHNADVVSLPTWHQWRSR
jgi:hypothetical protein